MNADARLGGALAVTAGVAALEAAGGLFAHSVALYADAAHVAMDAAALGIALAARVQARRPPTPRRSFGYARAEILAALVNGALLLAATAAIAVEAARRLRDPSLPDGLEMAAVAGAGLALNALVGWLLVGGGHAGHAHAGHAHAGHDHAHVGAGGELNLRAALLHVVGDAASSLAAVVVGLAVARGGPAWLDPALSLVVAAVIVAGVVGLLREAVDVLLESAPAHADVRAVRDHLLAHDGVVAVHDLHVWTLSGREHLLSAHVVLEDQALSQAAPLLRAVEASLAATYAITHVTIQIECGPGAPRAACVEP